MQSDLNKLVAKEIFKWTVVGDKVQMKEKGALKKIPDFSNDLNWAWKAVEEALKKQKYVGVLKMTHDGSTTTLNIHDADLKIASKVDLCHNDIGLTVAAALIVNALGVFGVSQEVALKTLYKGIKNKARHL